MVVTLCIMMPAVAPSVLDGDQTDVIQIEFYSDEPVEEIKLDDVVAIVQEFDEDAEGVEV
jgi:hypothetical protein